MYTLRIIDNDGQTSNFYLGDYYEKRNPTEEEITNEPTLVVFIHNENKNVEMMIKRCVDAYIVTENGKTFECINKICWHTEKV